MKGDLTAKIMVDLRMSVHDGYLNTTRKPGWEAGSSFRRMTQRSGHEIGLLSSIHLICFQQLIDSLVR